MTRAKPRDTTMPGDHQMWASHNIQWIGSVYYQGFPDNLPGAGNFLIFDNGTWNPMNHRSVALEIDGYDETTNSYVNPPDAGYNGGAVTVNGYNVSNQVVWRFASTMENSFYSHYISSVQRMPNGNTLIDAGAHGHFFEVTSDGEVVWEYINPVYSARGADPAPVEFIVDADGNGHSCFRCWRAPMDHPGLAGKKPGRPWARSPQFIMV